MLPLWQASEDGQHPYDHALHAVTSAPAGQTEYKEEVEATRSGTASPAPSSWFGSRGISKASRPKTFDPEKALADIQAHRPLKPARNPPETSFYDYIPFLLALKWVWRRMSRKTESVLKGSNRNALGHKIKPPVGDSNVPLEITIYLSNYAACMLCSRF